MNETFFYVCYFICKLLTNTHEHNLLLQIFAASFAFMKVKLGIEVTWDLYIHVGFGFKRRLPLSPGSTRELRGSCLITGDVQLYLTMAPRPDGLTHTQIDFPLKKLKS